jgi:hypothetical protein
MALKKVVSIRHALQHVADNPTVNTDVMLELPAYELVCRTLFQIANGAELDDRSSQSRANVARKLIFDRLVGKRRTGTHPATRQAVSLEFTDLTAHQVGDSDAS